ncbi:MAG: hypothetical protein FWC41_03505, partial [Firmicutes bacterium]|nr:hypothetical protein [Bacillota bacterium]
MQIYKNYDNSNYTVKLERELSDDDLSFESWLKSPNNYNRKYITNLYENKINKVNFEIEKLKSNVDGSSVLTNDLNKEVLNKEVKDLKENCKKMIEILEKANNEIREFKNFRSKYKELIYILEALKANEEKLVNPNFLYKFEKYTKKYEILKLKLDNNNVDFKKLKNDLLSEVKIEFEKSKIKIKDYLFNPDFYLRNILSFGSSNIEDPRVSLSGKFDKNEGLHNWMSLICIYSKLSELAIGIAHNSGSFGMGTRAYVDIVGEIAQNQTRNIFGQLLCGARALDLRMKRDRGVIRFTHNIVNDGLAIEAIFGIDKFLSMNPSEIIIITVGHCTKECLENFSKYPSVKKFIEKYVLYPKRDYPGKKISDLTINDFRKAGKNVIFVHKNNVDIEGFCCAYGYKSVFNKKILSSGDDKLILDDAIKILENRDKDKFNKTSILPHLALSDIPKRMLGLSERTSAIKKAKTTPYKDLLKNEKFRKFGNLLSLDNINSNETMEVI